MYYIAILAPDEINTEVLKWKHFFKERFGCTAALKSPAHITLISPFWMNPELDHDLMTCIKDFSNKQKKFYIRLKDFSAFAPKVIFIDVIKNEALESLHTAFNVFILQQNKFSPKKDEKIFYPHITLATRDLHKKAFYEAWKIFAVKKYEAEWLATGISLLRHNKKNWEGIFTSRFPE
jgi:2'-5' RNA ligase